jgi:hypothetical protein
MSGLALHAGDRIGLAGEREVERECIQNIYKRAGG